MGVRQAGFGQRAPDGAVVRQADSSGGAECALDGAPVALVDPARADRDRPARGGRKMVTAPAADGPSARRVEARRRAGDSHRAGRRRTVRTSRRGETWSGDTWEVIVGIGRDVTAGGCPQASCAAGGPEVADPDGALLASWSPDTDWVDPPADVPSPEAAIDVDTDGTGAFAVMADGSVLVRAADRRGGHAPRPPVPAGPSPVPAVDRSSSVVAGCVTHESGDRGVTTTCDIGQAR